MGKYRNAMPQLGGEFFITDGGIETTLIFHEGQDLPHFAAFHLLNNGHGEAALWKYFRTYAELAKRLGAGVVLETATWRANKDWAQKLGYDVGTMAEVNRKSVALLEEIRARYESEQNPVVISGCIGPRGDGYLPDRAMSIEEAADCHSAQVEVFAQTEADLVSAITMNYPEEAAGMALAAKAAGIPAVVSFTLETDGRLPTGHGLGQAIDEVDQATGEYPSYYMINCAHPSHFADAVLGDEHWAGRIRGLRANASRMSHAELNDAEELDAGNPAELGREYAQLKLSHLRNLNVMGGCCGTDHRHVEQIANACMPLFR